MYSAAQQYFEVEKFQDPDHYQHHDLQFPPLINALPAGYHRAFLKKQPTGANTMRARPNVSKSMSWEIILTIRERMHERRQEIEKHGGPQALARHGMG